MINDDFNFFKEQRENLVKEHYNEYVAIKNKKIEGFFPSETEALTQLLSNGYALGSFLVQKCVSQAESMVSYCTMRVAF